jgi:eukaryotic-like serine/threonine-protein kinase
VELATVTRRRAEVVGTPEYMAPEMFVGSASEQSDWYAFGAILFEMLTGVLPWLGDRTKVLLDKRQADAINPRSFAAGVPPDLDALTVRLLSRRPQDRPSREEVLDQLGAARERPTELKVPFLGRTAEIHRLTHAFLKAQEGSTVIATVRGPSGIGKSALALEFVEQLARAVPERICLMGRCHPEETVPYKALDAIMDALSRHISRLPAADALELRPRDVPALCRAFPVMAQVRAFASASEDAPESPDPVEQRRTAFDATSELFARLAQKNPLMLVIDDLQWGDDESIALLRHLLGSDSKLLLVGLWRTEDEPESRFLKTLLSDVESAEALERVDVKLGPLAEADATAVALACLGESNGESRGGARRAVSRPGAERAVGAPDPRATLHAARADRVGAGETRHR